jgi:hypothetical protein
MAIKSVGFRLGTEGKAEVKSDFKEVRDAGQQAMAGIADAAEASSQTVSAAADRAATRQVEAWKRMAAAAKVNAAGVSTASTFDAALATSGSQKAAVVNLDRSSGAARASAAVFEEAFRAEEQAAASALKLRAAIDPLWAAEQRLEQQLHEVAVAEKAGILTTDQLAAAQARARKEFDDTTNSIKRQSGAGGGLSKMQRQTLLYTASDIVGSSAYGINPRQLLLQQGPQVLQAFAAEEGGLAKIAALVNPVTIGVTAITAAVITGAAAWLDYANNIDKLNALSQGSGRVIGVTGQQLEANAEAAARAGNISVAAAREIEQGYVQLGGIGSGVLTGLTALTVDFAKATGQDTTAAMQQLGAAFADPVKGANELAIRYGALDQKTVEHIRTLVEQNDKYGAQRALLEALGPAFDGAADHANILARAWRFVANEASNAWTSMGKAIDRAMGGGTAAERIEDLYKQRASLLNSTLGMGDTSSIDKQIADIRQEMAKVDNAAARAKGASVMRDVVDGVTGGNGLGDLQQKLSAVNGLLADNGKAAGLSARQLEQARQAQDALSHAVSTYIPEGERQVRLAQLDARAAAAKSPAAKAAIAAEREQLEQRGKVITSAHAEALAVAEGQKAKAQASGTGASHAATLAREAASMQVSARAALDVADAYLKSSAAGMTAEARRKALTDATKRGIDVDAQVSRQQAIQVAEGAATGARTVAQLREETAARAAANDNVAAGKIAAAALNQTLSEEAALRPLLALRAVAQGDALTRLTAVIDAYRDALRGANVEGERSAALMATRATDEAIIGMRDQAEFAGDRSDRGAVEIARRAAEREAAEKYAHLAQDDPDRRGFIANKVSEARTKRSTDQTTYMAGLLNSQQDAAQLAERELALVGMSADKRQAIIDRLKAEIDLRARGIDLASAEAVAVLHGVDAQSDMNAKLKAANANMDELRSFAANTLDPSNWKSWGDAGKSILGDLKSEFIKLAVLNPLKNMLNGNSALPTLSSAFSSVAKLFGGGSAPGHNAAGTEYWSGGMTWVGENGPEIVSAPRGARISNAAQARQMLSAANDQPRRIEVQVIKGELFDLHVREIAAPLAAAAGQQAMIGGANMAVERISKRQRQSL